jgi:hypothetical protein
LRHLFQMHTRVLRRHNHVACLQDKSHLMEVLGSSRTELKTLCGRFWEGQRTAGFQTSRTKRMTMKGLSRKTAVVVIWWRLQQLCYMASKCWVINQHRISKDLEVSTRGCRWGTASALAEIRTEHISTTNIQFYWYVKPLRSSFKLVVIRNNLRQSAMG